jgi:hypothetical protein
MIVFTLVVINFNTENYKIQVHFRVKDVSKQIDNRDC